MELLANNMVYTINREFNSNMCVAVQNGEIIIRAPWYLSNKKIQKIIAQKRDIINRKLKEYENSKTKANRKINILGKEYSIIINYRNINKPELSLEKKSVKVILPIKYKLVDKTEILNVLIEKLYDKIAEKNIEFYMEKTRIRLGISPEDYEIKRMNNLYGKCDANKKIYINPEIMKFEPEIIEYIIMHEFCHLKYRIHSKGFIDMIEKNFQNYLEVEEKIKSIKY